MSPPVATPTPLLRRYTAWSLDAAAIGLLVVALMHRRLYEALETCARAIDALTQAMAALMQQTLEVAASPPALLQVWMADPQLQVAITALTLAVSALVLPTMAVFALVAFAWFSAFEGSQWQATPGKRLLGLQVVDDDGLPPGYVRAGLRNAAGLLSWVSFNIGHLMAARAPRHQALHDRIAGTRVLQPDPAPIPMLARLWLVLQPSAFFLLLALLMHRIDQSLAAALDATLGF
ncbi:RDD family protein [Luteimonas sp. 3794]|uniref:RDD family protein n=1 Tax=Luteimonas sp. 3794 TaxID=2817730 RepID=UPI002860D173|nr:RDD family protein [Luteimonas sp. 3794]MDR6989917.1 putative RDD family membrane protein YckC [Luteimonas sp. 3794]